MEKYLKKLELSENLTLQESIGAFEILMNGKLGELFSCTMCTGFWVGLFFSWFASPQNCTQRNYWCAGHLHR